MKLNWGFGIAAVYVVFAGSMILFAVIASKQHYDLVSDNYYDQAVSYQQKINEHNNGMQANKKLTVNYLADENALEIIADGNKKDRKGTLSFYKPDNAAADFQMSFSIAGSGKNKIPLKKMAHGFWKVGASWNVDDQKCSSETNFFIH